MVLKILPALIAVLNMFYLHGAYGEDEICRCYSVVANQEYIFPFDSKTWPPLKLSSFKKFYLNSIEDASSKIVKKIDYLDFPSEYNDYSATYAKYNKLKLLIENKYAEINWNSGPTYPSRMQALYDYAAELNKVLYDWDIAHENFLLRNKKCGPYSLVTGCRSLSPEVYEEHIKAINTRSATSEKLRFEKQVEVDQLFQQIASFCMQKHVNLRTYYEHALHQLNRGAYDSAMRTTEKLIQYATAKNKEEYLNAETYIQFGIACNMSFEYGQAIEALSDVLKNDPANVDAYVERAIAYFETGDYDLALKDFLASGNPLKRALPEDPNHLHFAMGFAYGSSQGLVAGAKELPASLMHSIHGISKLLWAGVTHPVDTYAEVSHSVHEMLTYLRSQDAATIAKNMVPELKELLDSWDTLESQMRGEKAGYILGKYGLEVVIPGTAVQTIKKYQHLRRANALCTLETMAVSVENRVVLEKLAHEAVLGRKQFFQSTKIHADKQGKHIVGHKNYDPRVGEMLQPSIFNHPEPARLLQEHAGKGVPKTSFKHGQGFSTVDNFVNIYRQILKIIPYEIK